MTPETIRDIYHQARSKAYNAQADYSQPVNQDRCDLAGWAAVIEACEVDTYYQIKTLFGPKV